MNPTEYLDQLDQARAAATPGEWQHNPVNGIHTPTGTCIALSCRHDDEKRRADAALIVAAVNAQPKLTAALRAVLDLADDWDRNAAIFPEYGDLSAAAARSIRTALTEALGGEL